VRVVGPEEMIVSKCFVAARDRFDGGDVAWLIRALGPALDWTRTLALMGEHWEILLWQLIHFLYVFPSERRAVPRALLARLEERLEQALDAEPAAPPICRGPLLDPKLYRRELYRSGGEDPRPRRELVEPHLIALHGRSAEARD
jgi:hypothetical protein